MKPEEINRVIAEFMGGPYFGDACGDAADMAQLEGRTHGLDYCKNDYVCRKCKDEIEGYYLSLDALVLVWEKANFSTSLYAAPFLKDALVKNGFAKIRMVEGYTIQEAAALATAKAILELTGKQVKQTEREE